MIPNQHPYLNPNLLRFDTVLAALNYRVSCPACQFKLEINDRDLATDMGYEYRGEKRNSISFYLGSSESETMTIDPITESVEITCNERNRGRSVSYYAPGSQGGVAMTKGKYSSIQYPAGLLGHAITIDCKQCSLYGYVLQIYVDMGSQKVCGLYLNSEWLAIEDGSEMHEIKNNYAIQKTYYNYWSGGKDQHAEIPLVGLNIEKPLETVDRVRKLLIFS